MNIKFSKQSKSNTEASSSLIRSELDLKKMIIKENCKIMEHRRCLDANEFGLANPGAS